MIDTTKQHATAAAITKRPSVHFTREVLERMLAERLGEAGGDIRIFWNVAPDGDMIGVTLWPL
jgi:hypothetical protein